MRGLARVLLVAVAPLALGGCGGYGYGLTQMFDPTELANVFDTKKPLPGQRQALFPEGVPGVSRGVPDELKMGARPAEGQEPSPSAAPAQPPQRQAAVEPQRPAAKAKPRPRPQATRPTPAPVQAQAPAPRAPAQSTQWPDPPRQTQQARPPAQPPQQQQQQQLGGGQVQWPAPPPTGTFSR